MNLNIVFTWTLNKVIGLMCAQIGILFFGDIRTLQKYRVSHCLHIITLSCTICLFDFNSRINIFPFLDKYTYKPLCRAAHIYHAEKCSSPVHKTGFLWMRVRNKDWWEVGPAPLSQLQSDPGGCCTLVVVEEIPPFYVKRFECLEKCYINLTNY